ncbi:MAG: MarR family transcriptional regulator [Pseudonocardia sp.]|nr:MarR family transcriptional regulator [Pseudonocardia sp.]
MTTLGAAETGAEAAELAARLRLVVGRLSRRARIDARGSLYSLQLSTLVTLDQHGPQQLFELARREQVAKSTMSRVLATMDQKGLVVRSATPDDARRLSISITPAGRARLLQVWGHPTALIRRRLERLEPTHRAALQAGLPALEALLDDGHKDSGP